MKTKAQAHAHAHAHAKTLARFAPLGWLGLAVCLSTSVVRADGAPLLSVGTESMSMHDVQKRLDALMPSQLNALGSTPEERTDGFVRDVLALELQQVVEARRRKLDRTKSGHDRQRVILARALEASLKSQIQARHGVSDAAIQAYFNEHERELSEPARIAAWRIVVASEERATQIIKECQGPDGVERWRRLARTDSIDRATHMRGGDLGFVQQDGSTDYPQLRVSPKVYEALDKVEDGALSPMPLKLDENYAVLWRRGSLPARLGSLDTERAKIRDLLLRDALAREKEVLLVGLKRKYLKHHKPALLEALPSTAVKPKR